MHTVSLQYVDHKFNFINLSIDGKRDAKVCMSIFNEYKSWAETRIYFFVITNARCRDPGVK